MSIYWLISVTNCTLKRDQMTGQNVLLRQHKSLRSGIIQWKPHLRSNLVSGTSVSVDSSLKQHYAGSNQYYCSLRRGSDCWDPKPHVLVIEGEEDSALKKSAIDFNNSQILTHELNVRCFHCKLLLWLSPLTNKLVWCDARCANFAELSRPKNRLCNRQ